MNKGCSGFTLLELLVVIILVGVLSVNVVSRWPTDGDLKLPAQAELFASHVRHAKMLAMYWGEPLQVSVSGSQYSVSCVTATATSPCNNSPVIDPATNQSFQVTLETGLAFSSAQTLDFDTLGRPYDYSVPELIGVSPAQTFTINAGTPTWTVTVERLTGFVVSAP